jgi:hypothetical protein
VSSTGGKVPNKEAKPAREPEPKEVLAEVAARIPTEEGQVIAYSVQRATPYEFAYTVSTTEDEKAFVGVITFPSAQ